MISVIIPALNEGAHLETALSGLQAIRAAGHEVILVDGGSEDGTAEVAESRVDRMLAAPRGRALQMNAGAREAGGEVLLFLHADTVVPPEAMEAFLEAFPGSRRAWGWFDVRLSGEPVLLRMIESLMNLRSRLSRIATGDHAIFVRKEVFERIGGYPEIPLMEDVAISRLLKRVGPPLCLRNRIVTSSRRWEEEGVIRTILLMWRLRLAYALGADPRRLAEAYYGRSAALPRGTVSE